mmetsp:Transcript_26557/g.91428  ORF Transcript_26557/g.91428 Transcript_26557/m.91428 type:complete len:249 (-) Transcript_26557:494-1240(-)
MPPLRKIPMYATNESATKPPTTEKDRGSVAAARNQGGRSTSRMYGESGTSLPFLISRRRKPDEPGGRQRCAPAFSMRAARTNLAFCSAERNEASTPSSSASISDKISATKSSNLARSGSRPLAFQIAVRATRTSSAEMTPSLSRSRKCSLAPKEVSTLSISCSRPWTMRASFFFKAVNFPSGFSIFASTASAVAKALAASSSLAEDDACASGAKSTVNAGSAASIDFSSTKRVFSRSISCRSCFKADS